jgi:hypothetical protein
VNSQFVDLRKTSRNETPPNTCANLLEGIPDIAGTNDTFLLVLILFPHIHVVIPETKQVPRLFDLDLFFRRDVVLFGKLGPASSLRCRSRTVFAGTRFGCAGLASGRPFARRLCKA